jgi:hypothetical protein
MAEKAINVRQYVPQHVIQVPIALAGKRHIIKAVMALCCTSKVIETCTTKMHSVPGHGQHQNIAESWNSKDTEERESFVRRHFVRFVVEIDIDLTFSIGKKIVQLESLRNLEVDIQVWNSNCSSSLTEVLQTARRYIEISFEMRAKSEKLCKGSGLIRVAIGKRISVRCFDINLFGCELSHNAKCWQDEDVAGCIEIWVAEELRQKVDEYSKINSIPRSQNIRDRRLNSFEQ